MANNLISLALVDGEPRVDSRLIAAELGVAHKNARSLVDNYLEEFQEFGQLPFETEVVYGHQGGGNPTKFYLLNEDQTYFLMTLVRNTDEAVHLKKRLVKAFARYRLAHSPDPRHVEEQCADLQAQLAACHAELLKLKPLWGKVARYKKLGLTHGEIGLLVGRSRDRARRHVRRLEACGLLPVSEPAQLSLLEG